MVDFPVSDDDDLFEDPFENDSLKDPPPELSQPEAAHRPDSLASFGQPDVLSGPGSPTSSPDSSTRSPDSNLLFDQTLDAPVRVLSLLRAAASCSLQGLDDDLALLVDDLAAGFDPVTITCVCVSQVVSDLRVLADDNHVAPQVLVRELSLAYQGVPASTLPLLLDCVQARFDSSSLFHERVSVLFDASDSRALIVASVRLVAACMRWRAAGVGCSPTVFASLSCLASAASLPT